MPGRIQPVPVHRPQKTLAIIALFVAFLWPTLLPAPTGAQPFDQPAEPAPCSQAWIQQISADAIGEEPAMMVAVPLSGGVQPRDARAWATQASADDIEAAGDLAPQSLQGIDLSTRPNDFAFLQNYQRNLLAMGAVEGWGVTFGTRAVTIAVIADGVEGTHEDLEQKLWRNPGEVPGNGVDDDGNGYVDDVSGWDFAEQDADASPVDDPRLSGYPATGTAMAGLAAAHTNNEIGIAGLAWHSPILPLKTHRLVQVGDRVGLGGKVDYVTEAICYAANAGAQVILLGGISLNRPEEALDDLRDTQRAIRYAWEQKGAVVVAPGGECAEAVWWCPDAQDYGTNPPSYPASLLPEMTIGVSSYDFGQNSQRRSASYGDWIDIAAPGENFYTTWRDDSYLRIGGTYNTVSDLAAAHVAGVAALVKAANPTYTPEMIERKLCEHAVRDPAVGFQEVEGRRWPHNPRWGCGRLDAEPVLERMPWQAVVSPDVIWMPIDHGTRERCGIVVSENLNEERLTLVTDKNWVRWRALPQRAGEKARLEVCVDVPRLSAEHGGRLQDGSMVSERVELKVQNPFEPTAEARSISDHLTINLAVAQQLQRAFIPLVFRAD